MKSSSGTVGFSKEEEEREVTAQRLLDSADKKAKEAEKNTDVATMKASLIESNASRQKSQEIMKAEVTKQEHEIKEVEDKLKLLK